MARQKKKSAESIVKDIKRQTRRKFSSEEKIRIVLEGLKGEEQKEDEYVFCKWFKNLNCCFVGFCRIVKHKSLAEM